MEDGSAAVAYNFEPAGFAPRTRERQGRAHRLSGTPFLANTRGGQSTVIEGSGRFVGEQPTGAIGRTPEEVTDGVTINLINVLAAQVAKTSPYRMILYNIRLWRTESVPVHNSCDSRGAPIRV